MGVPVSFVVESQPLPPLTPEQELASTTTGNVLIEGAAGVGKTRTMSDAVYHTVKNLSKDVLCLTFSHGASREWASRLHKKFEGDFDFTVSTFHSFAYNLLDQPKLASPEDIISFFVDELGEGFTSDKARNFEVKRVIQVIDRYKSCNEEILPWDKEFYDDYQKWLKRRKLIDFNDLINKCLESPLLHKYDRVFVDEFQDTSMKQYELIKKLSCEVVAMDEPCQRIYEWRDADKRNVERFISDFKPVHRPLTVSHRHSVAVIKFLESIYSRGVTTTRTNVEGIVDIKRVNDANEQRELVEELCKDGMPTFILAREQVSLAPYKKEKYVQFYSDDKLSLAWTPPVPKGVAAMTMHSVKGKERYRVIIVDCNEGLVPHKLSKNLTEEKNVFYVACARAEDELYIITHGEPSRWLKN